MLNKNSKYPKEVTQAMNTYFEAYENADQKALDEIACPNGVAYENMETCMEKYWSSDYADFVTIQYLHSYERKSI